AIYFHNAEVLLRTYCYSQNNDENNLLQMIAARRSQNYAAFLVAAEELMFDDTDPAARAALLSALYKKRKIHVVFERSPEVYALMADYFVISDQEDKGIELLAKRDDRVLKDFLAGSEECLISLCQLH